MSASPRRAVPLVSICIPTYNGGSTLAETLNSILSQGVDGVEVVVCDDASKDDTVSVAETLAHHFPCVRVVRNADNLGMDRNFARTIGHATGTYVWWSGQDDVFAPGALDKFRSVVLQHPDVDFIYFNYRFLSGDLSREVDPPQLRLQKDVFVTSAQKYFRVLDHAPTFLAANVMRREFWAATPYERFFGTHYVQMGVVLHNLANARVYIVADPRYIACRIPEDSWKRQGGQMLFEIFSGSLEVYDTVFHSDHNTIPAPLYREKMRHFLKMLPIRVVSHGALGFRRTPLIERRMKRLYGRQPLIYWLYVWPILHLPGWVGAFALRLHRSSLTRWIPRGVNKLVSWLGSRPVS
jgi:glycosyltransferase involved in cell wall biosynthesis